MLQQQEHRLLLLSGLPWLQLRLRQEPQAKLLPMRPVLVPVLLTPQQVSQRVVLSQQTQRLVSTALQ
jgi:hypothetical protein